MRLWSIHPKYLDVKGLLALWREGLLAQKVLDKRTSGYRNHPQLLRFKKHANPMHIIGAYLFYVYDESSERGYSFSKDKIKYPCRNQRVLKVTRGQLLFEFRHLMRKLKNRDSLKYKQYVKTKRVIPHPLFCVVNGARELWEKS